MPLELIMTGFERVGIKLAFYCDLEVFNLEIICLKTTLKTFA